MTIHAWTYIVLFKSKNFLFIFLNYKTGNISWHFVEIISTKYEKKPYQCSDLILSEDNRATLVVMLYTTYNESMDVWSLYPLLVHWLTRFVSVHISRGEPTLGRLLFSPQLRLYKEGPVIGMKFIGLLWDFNGDLQGTDIKSNRTGDFIIREMRKRIY